VLFLLVAFSVALLAMSVLLDVAGRAAGNAACAALARVDLGVATAGALAASVLALARVLVLPAWSRARRLACYRAAAQVGTFALAGAALACRSAPEAALALSAAASGVGALSAWFACEDAAHMANADEA
jgi:hypothetical protein